MIALRRFFPWLLVAAVLPALSGAASAPTGGAAVLRIDGPIGPATSSYVEDALDEARNRDAAVVILRMDTPGGLDTAMRDIIKAILDAPMPVASYVSPSGARAASAGTYILYASHVAAMAPGTNLGAATPVKVGPGGSPGGDGGSGDGDGDDDGKGSGAEQDGQPSEAEGEDGQPADGGSGSAMERKMVNDAVAYIRGLAELRGRNADWAEKAVREAASLSVTEAVEKNVVDLQAASITELLEQMDGRTVSVDGEELELATAGLEAREIDPDWRNRLLAVLTNPNVAYILMLLGIYGLIFEFANPGAVVPGVVGAISLLLALFAFQALPVSYAGVGLIVLGLLLMVAEAFAPSFGALGLGGAAAFVIGSVILMDTDAPGFGIDLGLIAAVAIFTGLVFVTLIGVLIRSRRTPVTAGKEALSGALGEARESFSDKGKVMVQGEVWQARARRAVQHGQPVRVVGREGMVLEVEPADDDTAE